MTQHRFLIAAALTFSAACRSDKSTPGNGNDSDAAPAAQQAKASVLPPLAPLGKPAAELEAEGWIIAEIPSELSARLRDSVPVEAELGFPALRSELRALAGNAPSFDSLGGFADTLRLIERRLIRWAAERRNEREAQIVDSLRSALEPRDPDLEDLSFNHGLLPPGPLPQQIVRPDRWSEGGGGGEPRIVAATFPLPTAVTSVATQQGSQTKTFQLAPGLEGTETTSSDGSSATVEMTRKGGNERGSAEVSAKGTTTLPGEFEKQGEVGWKIDLDTKLEGTVDGASGTKTKGGGREVRLSYCPDAAGHAKGRYKRWYRESATFTQKGVTYSQITTINAEFALTVQVDDEARATDLLVEGFTDVAMEMGSRGGGNSTPTIIRERGEARAQGVTPGDPSSLGSMHFRTPAGLSAAARKLVDGAATEELVNAIGEGKSLAEQAEQRWRNGACVEVTTTPGSKALSYGGKATFKVDVKHKRESAESFKYPVQVRAKLYNPGSDPRYADRLLGTLAPQGWVAAPVTYQYTAPAKGTPEAEQWPPIDRGYPISVSRRGIGVGSLYVPFDTDRRGYTLQVVHRVTSAKLGEERRVTMKAVIRELDTPDVDGNTFAGRGSYEGWARRYNPSCDNKGRTDFETITLAGKAKGGGNADEIGGGQTSLIFTITPLNPPENLPEAVLPALGNLVLTGESGQDSKTFEIQSDRCRGTLTHVTEWIAKRIR